MTFIFGGFVQTIGRLCRSNLRPLFLSATFVEVRGGPAPPQTPLKRAYDAAGTVACIFILNYLAAPFMLLTVHNSLLAWGRLAWYGHWMVIGAMAFFYGGGTKWLRHRQAARVKKAGVKQAGTEDKTDGTVTPGNGARTLPPFDDVAREVEKTKFMRSLSD